MSSPGHPQAVKAVPASAAAVIEFLRAHPTFLDQHPELLRQLSIPHASSGEAVSLLERQVAVLREDNQRLRQQFDRLVAFARANENLNARIHALVLKLMQAAGPRAIFDLLEAGLRADFGAERVAILVFAETTAIDHAELGQFVGRAAPARAAFAALLAGGAPVCAQLAAEQHVALFGTDTAAGSAVLMPLVGSGWDGVLVIASDDATRYQADMGTELLTYLKDVVTLVIDSWVKRARAG